MERCGYTERYSKMVGEQIMQSELFLATIKQAEDIVKENLQNDGSALSKVQLQKILDALRIAEYLSQNGEEK